MAAFSVRLRRGPVRTVSAGAAAVLAAIGGTVSMPLAAADGPALAEQHISWTDTADTPLTAGTVSVAAVATSGLPVQYASTSTDVCTAGGDVVTLAPARALHDPRHPARQRLLRRRRPGQRHVRRPRPGPDDRLATDPGHTGRRRHRPGDRGRDVGPRRQLHQRHPPRL